MNDIKRYCIPGVVVTPRGAGVGRLLNWLLDDRLWSFTAGVVDQRDNAKKGARAMAEKLAATVLEITDLGGAEEQIELDIQVQQGDLSTAARVRLSGPGSGEEIEISSVYMLGKPGDRSWARIICSRPKSLTIPTGELRGWKITEL
jgi:hypothetical protein